MKLDYKKDVVCTPRFTLACIAEAIEAFGFIYVGSMMIADLWSYLFVTFIFLAKIIWTAVDLCCLSSQKIRWYRYF